jgi:hypothetical protein
MATTDTTIRFVRDSDYSFSATVYRGEDVIDLTGATLTFTAKWTPRDTDPVFTLTDSSGISVTNPANGEITITIPSTATADLPYDEVRLAYDLYVLTSTNLKGYPLRGTLIISPNITRS